MRPRVTRILLGDHEVEPPRRQFEEPLLGRHLRDLDAQTRFAVGQEAQRARQDRLGRRLQHGDPHGSDAGPERFELAADLLLEFERAGRVRGERDAVLGEPHAPAVGDQQRNARVLLQLRELLRDRRRAVRQRLGDGGQRAAQRQFVQQAQTAQLEHGASLPLMR